MLVTCPECAHEISDKASACPNCGYPLKRERPYRPRRKQRLPNGFGRITEVRGKSLREPFRVMITVGKDQYGRPIGKLLKPKGYFKTYNEAYMALAEYHRNPYDLDSVITVDELYKKWFEMYLKQDHDDSLNRRIRSNWKYTDPAIKSMLVKELRSRHIRSAIENAQKNGTPATENIKAMLKYMWNQMMDFAVEYELADKNYARAIKLEISVETKNEHIIYTPEEMEILESNKIDPLVQMILVQCYSGWRPQELMGMTLDHVDLEEWSFTGGLKTEAGKNRTVPIHSHIQPLVKYLYDEAIAKESNYLFSDKNGEPYTYACLWKRNKKVVDELNLNPAHRLHDGRKHFVTMAKKANVNEYCLKLMVGHNITDLTEKIYTQRSLDWLRSEIEKIP